MQEDGWWSKYRPWSECRVDTPPVTPPQGNGGSGLGCTCGGGGGAESIL